MSCLPKGVSTEIVSALMIIILFAKTAQCLYAVSVTITSPILLCKQGCTRSVGMESEKFGYRILDEKVNILKMSRFGEAGLGMVGKI